MIKTPAYVEPRASVYYELAANGVFQVHDTPTYRAVTHTAEPIPGLLPESEHLQIRCPRLPRAQIEETLAFFAEVYRRYEAEAIVLIFYSPGRRVFYTAAPPQTLALHRDSSGRVRASLAVRYRTIARPPGFVRLGTIHSHADLPAYPSHIDAADEQYEDGLHIVFGQIGGPELSVAASFVANGVRFRLAPGDVLEPHLIPKRPSRSDWMAQVHIEEPTHVYSGLASPYPRQPDDAALEDTDQALANPAHAVRQNTREQTARRRG